MKQESINYVGNLTLFRYHKIYWSWTSLSAASPVDLVLTVTVDTRVAEALVDLREAGGVVVTFRTHAGEAVDAVDTGAAVAES